MGGMLCTMLHTAAKLMYLAPKMESLLHEIDKNGSNMVHRAAQGGHADVIRFVIDKYKLDSTTRDVVSVY